jgi:hypothetical protein
MSASEGRIAEIEGSRGQDNLEGSNTPDHGGMLEAWGEIHVKKSGGDEPEGRLCGGLMGIHTGMPNFSMW